MSIGILAAQTGRGHVSVMKTLYKEFINCGVYDVKCFPSFYEDMMISNKILSDFYNFLMINSTSLCRKYGEFTYLTKSDMSEDFYIGVKNFIVFLPSLFRVIFTIYLVYYIIFYELCK